MNHANLFKSTDCSTGHSVRIGLKTVRRTLCTPLGVVQRVSGQGKKEKAKRSQCMPTGRPGQWLSEGGKR